MERRKGLKRSSSPMKRTRISPVSLKRLAETEEREAVRQTTLFRAGWKCQAKALVPEVACWGGLDVHEIVARSAYPGGHLDDTNTLAICRAHHGWVDENNERARELGLLKRSWERQRPDS